MGKPTAQEINETLAKVMNRVNFYGDEPITDAERQSLARVWAYVTAQIRGKYELKTDVYFTAECQAVIDTRKKYGDDFLQ